MPGVNAVEDRNGAVPRSEGEASPAPASVAGGAADLGCIVRGVFAGVERGSTGQRTFVRIEWPDAAWRNKPAYARCEFTPFDPHTGSPSPVAEQLAACVAQVTRVEVFVSVGAMPYKGQAFPTYVARGLRVLK